TNKVYFLYDGEAVVVNKLGVKVYDLKTEKEKNYQIKTLDWKEEETKKGKAIDLPFLKLP
ncbi:MAG: hypothetical protein N2445_09285, partial [Acidobacteria bacterium]|nr:hypothetical protein [Acidobacteriota bacterium]